MLYNFGTEQVNATVAMVKIEKDHKSQDGDSVEEVRIVRDKYEGSGLVQVTRKENFCVIWSA